MCDAVIIYNFMAHPYSSYNVLGHCNLFWGHRTYCRFFGSAKIRWPSDHFTCVTTLHIISYSLMYHNLKLYFGPLPYPCLPWASPVTISHYDALPNTSCVIMFLLHEFQHFCLFETCHFRQEPSHVLQSVVSNFSQFLESKALNQTFFHFAHTC